MATLFIYINLSKYHSITIFTILCSPKYYGNPIHIPVKKVQTQIHIFPKIKPPLLAFRLEKINTT